MVWYSVVVVGAGKSNWALHAAKVENLNMK